MNTMLHVFVLFFTAAFFFFFNAAVYASPPIKAAGCKTEYFLIQDLARGYKSKTAGIVIPQKTGNKVAIKLLTAQQVDFAFTCKPQDNLIKKFNISPEITQNWKSFIIANDPIIVVIHRENGIISLTLEQLSGIFSGKIKNWKEIGGIETPIQVAYLDKTVESGVLTLFKELVPDSENNTTKQVKLRPDAFQAAGPKQLGAYVAQNPGGISFMALSSYRRRYGSKVNINGVPPNRETIKDGSYPLTVTYHIIYDKRKEETLKSFLGYIQSQEGISIINQGFISRTENR
ncbi:ABC-type phosphate transport system, periplasmic component [Desulfocapsa sulfexigens DSM 10523]|uniref:ABC-type phosphate transport system, periplasmic component n=1 Tax=Desulfocapsa sulfexigens (strain DSM 10523 / SB164P1) TaxID=1167006 RepID=M1PDN5_DESSD|nr:substrate-binding domain-containing protein [Desulfocapsa sulfexigens]AGF77835.1 ABC-type phosphate transport system, periplasmic component [Desulfocapsa sulfexigens DSM 10523]